MSPRIVNKQAKKEAIIQKATEVISAKGIYSFKMSDVADAADVGKGTLYEYFKDKEELVTACYVYFLDSFIDIADSVDLKNSARANLRSYISVLFKHFSKNIDSVHIAFDFWSQALQSSDNRQYVKLMTKAYNDFVAVLIRIIKDGIKKGEFRAIDVEKYAAAIVGMLDGILFQGVMGINDITDAKWPRVISNMILNGLSKTG
ncbi:MAG: TetR family transcriptional regulator [candidate division Zixibacteria bacterium]|nr:TetR family transcriptional regulator [candidate division Zixibacteria bacterium]